MEVNNHNILVLGGSGLLGSQLLSGNYFRGYRCLSQGRGNDVDIQADLQDVSQVRRMLIEVCPVAIINLIGLTNVDLCESSPNESYRVNVRPLQHVFEACRSLKIKPRVVHISTDQVYDGIGPHKENEINLTNYYAFSKYAAELVANSERCTILRTNFFGKSRTSKRTSFTDWLYKELSSGNSIHVFEDVLFSPLSMQSLCEMIEATVCSDIDGVFNLGAHDGLSKADFAFLFADFLGLPKNNMHRCKSTDVDFIKAYRPKDMRLDVTAFEKAMSIKLPNLSSEIERTAKEYPR